MDYNDYSAAVAEDNLTGVERSMMVKTMKLKYLKNEHRLFESELKALAREIPSLHVEQRKEFLTEEIPRMKEEMELLKLQLTKMINADNDSINPSGKYYVLAEKLVKV